MPFPGRGFQFGNPPANQVIQRANSSRPVMSCAWQKLGTVKATARCPLTALPLRSQLFPRPSTLASPSAFTLSAFPSPRTRNQEPRTKNKEQRTKNKEPRTKHQEQTLAHPPLGQAHPPHRQAVRPIGLHPPPPRQSKKFLRPSILPLGNLQVSPDL